jgi:hypothetical protein
MSDADGRDKLGDAIPSGRRTNREEPKSAGQRFLDWFGDALRQFAIIGAVEIGLPLIAIALFWLFLWWNRSHH